MPFLNEKRLRNYPRLFLISIWVVMVINVIFHRGWIGRFGGIIGVDFVCIYSGGWLYRYSFQNLYDIPSQALIQQELFQPTPLNGTVNIYAHTPYAALVYSLMTYFPIVWALAFWTLLSLLSAFLALFLIHKHIFPDHLRDKISLLQLTTIVFSSFPFVIGVISGQSQSFTLLLFTGIAIAMIYDRWLLAGVLAGLLIYKPHFVIGYLILWVVWKKYKSILGFAVVTLPWLALDIIPHGLGHYQTYLNLLNLVTRSANAEGFNWELTPYALFHKFFPTNSGSLEMMGTFLLLGLASAMLAIYAHRYKTSLDRSIFILLATIFPYLVAPRILLYDLVLMTLIFALWSRLNTSKTLLYIVIFTYLASFILPLATKYTGIALLAFIPLIIFIVFIVNIVKPSFRTNHRLIDETKSTL